MTSCCCQDTSFFTCAKSAWVPLRKEFIVPWCGHVSTFTPPVPQWGQSVGRLYTESVSYCVLILSKQCRYLWIYDKLKMQHDLNASRLTPRHITSLATKLKCISIKYWFYFHRTELYFKKQWKITFSQKSWILHLCHNFTYYSH